MIQPLSRRAGGAFGWVGVERCDLQVGVRELERITIDFNESLQEYLILELSGNVLDGWLKHKHGK